MRIDSARDLGLVIKDRRRDLGMSQVALASTAGVSRRWLSDLEGGKATAEVGLILRTLHALGLRLDAGPARTTEGTDLDQVLRDIQGDR